MKNRNPKNFRIRELQQKDNCRGCKSGTYMRSLKNAIKRSFQSFTNLWRKK